jgi:hypothetical protein
VDVNAHLRWGHLALAVLITLHTLLAYGLPPAVPLVGTLVLGGVYVVVGPANALLIAAALLGATLLYSVALRVTGLDQSMYYRPHEVLQSYNYTDRHRAFLPGGQVHMHVPQGDMQSMTSQDIREPHDVVCRTDSDGFRNERDYAGQRYVLVGDSFVAGINNTQEDTLSSQLRELGIDVYNLAYPGEVDDYLRYVDGFQRRHGSGFRVLLFLFEGNDFPTPDAYRLTDRDAGALERSLRSAGRRYRELFSTTNVYRFTSSAYKRLRSRRKIAAGEALMVEPLAGRAFALYRPYAQAAAETRYSAPERFEQVLLRMTGHLLHIFFIPDKFRVYHRHLRPAEPPLPTARWDYLVRFCAEHSLRCTDLTPALMAASDRLLPAGRLTWWRDDTHWNREGIAAAAAVVAQVVRGPPGSEASP